MPCSQVFPRLFIINFHRKLRNMEGPDKVSLESSILRVHNTLLSCSGVALQPCTVLVQTSIYTYVDLLWFWNLEML